MNGNEQLAKIRQSWRPPPELNRSMPREVRLTKSGVAVSILAMVFVAGGAAAGVGLGLRAVHERQRREAVEANGRETQAVITRLWRTGDKNATRKVAYTFDWEGHTYRSNSEAPRKIWSSLKSGDSIPIRLLPSNPEWNYPSGWRNSPLAAWLPPLLAVFLWCTAYLLYHGLGRQKRLLAEGRPAPAVILKRLTNYHRHGNRQSVLTYEYLLPGGQTMKGRVNARARMETGSVQCALFLPENPQKSALYPLELVRPGE
jgi:hypothetical protein